MKKLLLSFVFGLVLLSGSGSAHAAAQEGIAAVVNDSVITISDIRDRTDLYLSGGTPVAEQRKQMEQQVLDRLINEALQVQEAKKLGIIVAEEDVTAGFADISRQNNLPPEEFKKRLVGSGIHIDSLYNQIRADIAWSQVVRRKLRPEVNVSESEIDMTLNQIASGTGKPQYHVAEIFLAVPTPAQEADTRDTANKLVTQLTQGASFSSIARQSSQAPGAAGGGDLGWVQEGQLDPALDKVLKSMQPGQVSPPVRSAKGYHILFLRELRQNTSPTAGAEVSPPPAPVADAGPVVTLKQIVIPVGEKDPESVLAVKIARAKSLKDEIKSCADMDKKMKDFPASGTGTIGKGPQNNMPPDLRAIVEKLQVGELSAPIRNPAGVAVIMVCAREEAPPPAQANAALPKFSPDKNDPSSRQKVASTLGMQRLNQLAERYLRDLRATAFIDKRI